MGRLSLETILLEQCACLRDSVGSQWTHLHACTNAPEGWEEQRPVVLAVPDSIRLALSKAGGSTAQIAIPVTFRVWITPGQVVVWANEESIYIVDTSLEVKLESEVLAGTNSALPSLPGVPLISDSATQKFA